MTRPPSLLSLLLAAVLVPLLLYALAVLPLLLFLPPR